MRPIHVAHFARRLQSMGQNFLRLCGMAAVVACFPTALRASMTGRLMTMDRVLAYTDVLE